MKQILKLDDNQKRIKGITFGPLNHQEIAQVAELQVTSRELYNTQTMQPVPGGALDRRLGTSDKASVCQTCGCKLAECTGHFGEIPLVLPVFNIGFFKAALQVLQCICKSCSRVLLTEPEREAFLKRLRNPRLEGLQKVAIVKAVYDKCRKVVACPTCQEGNGLVKKVGVMKVVHERYGGNRSTLAKKHAGSEEFYAHFQNETEELKPFITKAQEDITPLVAYNLFLQVSEEDAEVLGLGGRPEDFMWTTVPVPPSCIRPSVAMTLEGGTNEDDLTIKLSEIVYTNMIIRDALGKGAAPHMLIEDWDFLQLQCAMYINSELPGIAMALQATGRPIRGLCQRLKGKMGRFRGNLSGKRVDFSGRTVISPDPNLQINEVGVPIYVAKQLTFPEVVTKLNIERMRELVLNGPEVHPGANFVTSGLPEGALVSGSLTQSEGIKRFLKFGDRRKIAKDLRIGDIVERHLQDGDVVLFNRQPSLHRLSIMAHRVRVRPWRTFRFNECACTPYNADFDGDEMNLHLPQTQEARAEALQLMGLQHNLVTPRNGQPLIGATQDFITASHLITHRDVFFTKEDFCQTLAMMGDGYLHFSLPEPAIFYPAALWTGKQIISVLLNPNPRQETLINLECKAKTFTLVPKGAHPCMCPVDGYVIIRNSELLCGTLDKSTVGGDSKNSVFYILLRDYSCDLAVSTMTRLAKLCARYLGNRGFSIGIDDVQPSRALTALKQDLVTRGNTECDRNISEFKHGALQLQAGCTAEQTLEACISGILSKIRDDAGSACIAELPRTNAPLIMQWCGSKGSKINVSQMVAIVGQQIISGSRIPDGFHQRSLPHFPKSDRSPAAKGFVQNSFYTGLSPTEFFFHAVSGREGLVDTAVKTAETGYMQRRLMKALEDLSTAYDKTVRMCNGNVVQFCYGDDGLDPAMMEAEDFPLHLNRLFLNVRNYPSTNTNLDVMLDWNELEQVCQELPEKFTQGLFDFLRKQQAELSDTREPLTSQQAIDFLGRAKVKYERARIEPGSAVGALGAQSIGEPGTQMTLKTFHFAGVASMNVTLGVPRIKEIINAARNISTPIITAPLAISDSLPAARIVKGRIELTKLGEVCDWMQEIYSCDASQAPGLLVKVDMRVIQQLQLEVTLDDLAMAIAKHPKNKVSSNRIQVIEPDRLLVRVPQVMTGKSLAYAAGKLGKLALEKNTQHARSGYFALQHLKRTLPNTPIVGIPSVSRAVINDLGGKRYNLLVEGNGLRQVMTTPGILGSQCTSNNIMEMEGVLGIEAARATIAHEIQYTMAKHGMTIDPRHVTLLSDLMTLRGQVLGITRFGIARLKDDSVLMLASFERTTDHLFDAARYGRQDKIEGVSESIIMGVPMPVGTGTFKLVQCLEKGHVGPRDLLFDRPEYHQLQAF